MLDNIGHPQNPTENQIQHLIKLYNQGKLEEVFEQTSTLIKQYPNSLGLWNLLGISAAQIDKLDKAIDAFKKVISIKPDYADAYNNMGNALKGQGKLEEAIEAYNKVLSIKPDYADAYYNMGNTLKEQGKLEEAIEAYSKEISIQPDNPRAYNNMGNALKELGQLEEAAEAYNNAISIKPDYAEAYYNMGSIFQEQGRLNEAIEAYNKALSIKPDYADAYYNMGVTFNVQGKYEEELEAYKKALSIQPNYAEAYSNLGIALKNQGKYVEAIEAYNKALSIKPDYAEAYNNMSFAKLKTKEWKHGIKLREWRWKTHHFKAYERFFKAPQWDGEAPLDGKTLLIWGEQGPGDIIIWCSCLNYYSSIGANIIIECPQKLLELLTISFPKITVRLEKTYSEQGKEDFDYHIPMETLFGHACSSEKISSHQRDYIFPDEIRVEYWRNRLKTVTEKPCVGISWKSPVMNHSRQNNYADLSFWKPLLQNNKYTFFNLQSSNFEDDLKTISQDFGVEVINFYDLDHYDDLADVAAFCKALDLSISVATTVAVISAAVGTHTIIPTWEQGPWNNILFNSRGPKIDLFYRNTWESWENTFSNITKMLS